MALKKQQQQQHTREICGSIIIGGKSDDHMIEIFTVEIIWFRHDLLPIIIFII